MPAKRDENQPCTKCGGKRKRSPAGLVYCADCNRRYREENREKRRKKDLENYYNNKQRKMEKMKAYRQGERIPRRKGKSPNENVKMWRTRGDTGSRHPDYPIWSRAKDRCFNQKNPDYSNYGGREEGKTITMCLRWKESFKNFLEDMGPRPEPRYLYSIERLDVNGDYEPKNCVWATKRQQANNTRRNVSYRTGISDEAPIFHLGRWMSLKEFSGITKINLTAVKWRYSQHPFSVDWIIDADGDARHHEYKGIKYNLSELSHISGVSYPILRGRILVCGWTAERAIHEEVVRRG